MSEVQDAAAPVSAEPKVKRYRVNEVFYSVQGEGKRAGTANVFVRLTGCNMRCAIEPGPRSPGGFDCDTEFESGSWMTIQELIAAVRATEEAHNGSPERSCGWIVLTGGEPGLQLDLAFCDAFHAAGYQIAVETNGSILLPMRHGIADVTPDDLLGMETPLECGLDLFAVDWITVSPKVAEHAIRQVVAHELKYVRGGGQAIPRTRVKALHRLLSPAFNGLAPDREAIATCVALVKENPEWALSVQLHKSWLVR